MEISALFIRAFGVFCLVTFLCFVVLPIAQKIYLWIVIYLFGVSNKIDLEPPEDDARKIS